MRHRERHVHKTLFEHVRTTLEDTGWLSDPVNFGAHPITLIDFEPLEAGQQIAPNTVAVSMGDQGKAVEAELGALRMLPFTLFVDVHAENESIGTALADDIRDALEDLFLPLHDWAAGQDTEETIELESVVVEKIASTVTADRRTWRAVKAMAYLYYS